MKKLVCILYALCLLLSCAVPALASPDWVEVNYTHAIEAFDLGDYYNAYELFLGQKEYKDSPNYIVYCHGMMALEENRLSDASGAFSIFKHRDFLNGKELNSYVDARILEDDGKLSEAIKIYGNLTVLDGKQRSEALKRQMLTTKTDESDFEYDVYNDGVSIVEYIGSEVHVDVPETIRGIPVTDISDYAFYEADFVESINLPDSITSIGDYAFEGCLKLKSVVIPQGVVSLGEGLFNICISLEKVYIPRSVVNMGSGIFNNCRVLTSDGVHLENGFIIENGVLYDSSKELIISALKKECTGAIVIADTVRRIGNRAFENCVDLTSITFPETVREIGESAFAGCSMLERIDLKEGVVSIGRSAFEYCESLSYLSIPNSLTELGDFAIGLCHSLKQENLHVGQGFLVEGGVLYDLTNRRLVACLTAERMTSVTIREGIKTIGWGAFYDCEDLETIIIPESIETIGDEAFASCNGLTQVVFPEGVKSIGSNAFFAAINLVDVTVPDTVTNIGDEAFPSYNDIIVRCGENSYAKRYCEENGLNVLLYGIR